MKIFYILLLLNFTNGRKEKRKEKRRKNKIKMVAPVPEWTKTVCPYGKERFLRKYQNCALFSYFCTRRVRVIFAWLMSWKSRPRSYIGISNISFLIVVLKNWAQRWLREGIFRGFLVLIPEIFQFGLDQKISGDEDGAFGIPKNHQ